VPGKRLEEEMKHKSEKEGNERKLKHPKVLPSGHQCPHTTTFLFETPYLNGSDDIDHIGIMHSRRNLESS